MGRLVQQSTAARTDRGYPTGRVRGDVLRKAGRFGQGGWTQLNESPGKPGRFSFSNLAYIHSARLREVRGPSDYRRPAFPLKPESLPSSVRWPRGGRNFP
jgi:hypothetical protein